MTTPEERTRNVLQAGAFLKELQGDKSLPEAIRREAHRLLRHYPTVGDIKLLAKIEGSATWSTVLTPEFDPAWTERYKFGPHKG